MKTSFPDLFCLFAVFFDICHKTVEITLICSVLQNTEFSNSLSANAFAMAAVTLPLSCKISSSLNWRNASKRLTQSCIYMIFPRRACLSAQSRYIVTISFRFIISSSFKQFWRLKHPTCEYALAEHFPSCQAHVWFCAIGSSINNLSRRMMSDSVMKLILYCGKKLFCNRTVHIIVSTALGVNVRDF